MRRLRRHERHHRQSGPRLCLRPPRRPRWHRGSGRNAGNLWRRTSSDPPGDRREGRPEAHRAHPLVGGLYAAQQGLDGQQSLARQQARRADHDLREIPRRRRQGRHDPADRRLQIWRARHRQGVHLHGFARLRPGLRHRADRVGLQCRRLHHRPGLGLRLQTRPMHQGRDQHRHVYAHDRGHGHQCRRHADRRRVA